MPDETHPENYSVEEIVTVHYRENKRAAVALFNGHIEEYKLDAPMTRTEYNEFHNTHIKK